MSAPTPQEIFEKAHAEGRSVLLEHEGYALLAAVGLDTPRHIFVPAGETADPAALAGLGSPEVVLKVVSPDILHKSDVGGIAMIHNEPAVVTTEIERMLRRVSDTVTEADVKGILVVEKIDIDADTPGSEYLLSVRRDPAFGPVLMFGLGGLLSEWYGDLGGDNAHLLFAAEDFDRDQALAAIEAGPLGEIAVKPSRIHAKPPLDGGELASALQRLARTIQEPVEVGGLRLEELELNPIVAKDGRLLALDALAQIGVRPAPVRKPRPVAKIRNLLHPRSAVVYGASTKAMNAGRIILQNLKKSEGITYGKLWAVHPKADRIDGVPCCRSAAELPQPVDLAVISIPAPVAPAAIRELAEGGYAKSIILIPGGFSETGHGELNVEIRQILSEARDREDEGPVMVGGNCLGIVSKREYNTFFLPAYKLPFSKAPGNSMAAVSQSGAYLVTFTSNLDGIVFPRALISYGNEMDLTASDFLEYYLEYESDIRVISFYIEGFKPDEGERFIHLVRQATKAGKAIVLYKAGKTEGGAAAAASHTASIAGDYKVAQSVLKEAGALVCETLNQFEDYTRILTMLGRRPAKGRRVGVVTNAGFEAGAVSDHMYGLELAQFSDETRAKLTEVLPEIAYTGNPIDATPMTDTAGFIKSVEIMAACDEVDALIVSAIPATPTLDILAPDMTGEHQENIYSMTSLPAELIRVNGQIDKPMVVTIDSGRLYDASVMLLQRARIPVYRKIDRASRALSAMIGYQLR